nr:hypothetical protein [Brachybacterium avium]
MTRTHRPPITAIGRSAIEYGRVAATRLLEVIEAGRSRRGASQASLQESRAIEPGLVVRASTRPDGATAASPAAGPSCEGLPSS